MLRSCPRNADVPARHRASAAPNPRTLSAVLVVPALQRLPARPERRVAVCERLRELRLVRRAERDAALSRSPPSMPLHVPTTAELETLRRDTRRAERRAFAAVEEQVKFVADALNAWKPRRKLSTYDWALLLHLGRATYTAMHGVVPVCEVIGGDLAMMLVRSLASRPLASGALPASASGRSGSSSATRRHRRHRRRPASPAPRSRARRAAFRRRSRYANRHRSLQNTRLARVLETTKNSAHCRQGRKC